MVLFVYYQLKSFYKHILQEYAFIIFSAVEYTGAGSSILQGKCLAMLVETD